MLHLSDEQLNNYSRRKMSVREMIEADNHLATCDECQNHLKDLAQLQTSFTSLMANYQEAAKAKITHLSFEQLSGYVNKRLDRVESEIVESHVDYCSRCAKELKDLQAFAAALSEEAKEETRKSFLQTLLVKFSLSPDKESSEVNISSNKGVLGPLGLSQWASVMGAMVMLIGAAVLFILYISPFFNQPHVANVSNKNSSRKISTPSPKDSLVKNANESPVMANANTNQEPTSAIATFILPPSGSRDSNDDKKLVIGENVKTVRLVVGVEGKNYKKYKATLTRVGGARAFLGDSMKAVVTKAGKAFIISIPAELLESEDYFLKVDGITAQGISKEIDIHQLRVTKK